MNIRHITYILLASTTTFISGVAYQKSRTIDTTLTYTEIRENKTLSKLTNPLLECSFGPDYLSNNHANPSKQKIENFITDSIAQRKITHASVYYRDLNNGPWMGINEKEQFFPASLMKVPLAMYFYKESEHDPSILTSTISPGTIVQSTLFEQYFKPSQTIDINKKHTVQELITASIMYSDNFATEALVLSMKEGGLRDTLSDLHLNLPQTDDDYMRVKDYATFFRVLFNASYLSQDNSEKLLKLLSETKFNNGITKYLPKDISVAHKFGEKLLDSSNIKQFHDCGIVYVPTRPYLACIMIRGTDMDKATETSALISKMIYNEVIKQL